MTTAPSEGRANAILVDLRSVMLNIRSIEAAVEQAQHLIRNSYLSDAEEALHDARADLIRAIESVGSYRDSQKVRA